MRMSYLLALVSFVYAASLEEVSYEAIQKFMKDNSVKTVSELVGALPDKLKSDWIIMNNSESAQLSPRVIIQGNEAKFLMSFSVAKGRDGKYLDNTVEIIEWNEKEKKFDFRLIDFTNAPPTHDASPKECASCHKGRPNWDPYDSWANMLPYNRDRLYENSEEQKSFTQLLLENADDPRFKTLKLPNGVKIEDDPSKKGKKKVVYTYTKNDTENEVEFKGKKYTQGGNFIFFSHSANGERSDEGRGVRLFDDLTVLNAKRVAREIRESPNYDRFKYALMGLLFEKAGGTGLSSGTGLSEGGSGEPVKPEALDAMKGSLDEDFDKIKEKLKKKIESLESLESLSSSSGISSVGAGSTSEGKESEGVEDAKPIPESTACLATRKQFEQFIPSKVLEKNEKEYGNLETIEKETLARQKQMPAQKIKLQRENIERMIRERMARERIRLSKEEIEELINREMLRRNPKSFEVFDNQIVDREIYSTSKKIAQLRYLLEPEGVSLNNWSLSVMSRSKTLTFADQFDVYLREIASVVQEDLQKEKTPIECGKLEKLSFKAYQTKPKPVEATPPASPGSGRTH